MPKDIHLHKTAPFLRTCWNIFSNHPQFNLELLKDYVDKLCKMPLVDVQMILPYAKAKDMSDLYDEIQVPRLHASQDDYCRDCIPLLKSIICGQNGPFTSEEVQETIESYVGLPKAVTPNY
jgi:hypothetical protein